MRPSWQAMWSSALVGIVLTPAPVRAQNCTEQKLTDTTPAAAENYGSCVSISGDTLIVGCVNDSLRNGDRPGSAFVYVRSGSTWTLQQKLTSPDPADFDGFGGWLAVSGDTAAIGATGDDHSGQDGAGAVYVFTRSGTTWTFQQKLVAPDAAGGDQFGGPVRISGESMIVGAWGDDIGANNDAGSASVFTRSGGTWSFQQKLTASDAAAFDHMANADISGDTAIVGAPNDDNAAGFDAGAAYVFTRSGNTWTQQQKVTAPDGAGGAAFGAGTISGNTMVIGANAASHAGGVNSGAAYVFVRSGGAWSLQQKLTASDAADGDRFGWVGDCTGDSVIISAFFDDHSGLTNPGAAYIFTRSGTTWTQKKKLTASDAADDDWLGITMGALSGSTAVVATYNDDHAGFVNAGAAYVFQCDFDSDGDGLLDSWEIDGIPYVDAFGATQLYVLDADGDGITECDPQHKDLFVEVDAMSGLGPASAAISRVVNAFAAAPVSNPDGLNGVALHVVVDDLAIPAAAWTLDDIDSDGDTDWPTEFDALKLTASSGTTLAGYFGTAVERNDPDAAGIRTAKIKAYRYCIFGQQFDDDGTSGLAELPGNDFIVTLGLWTPTGGSVDQQAGTFMHEMGHTLGLGHGGRAANGTPDHINHKPNYHSVMSYNWQTPKPWMTPGSWPLDGARTGYSAFAIASTLNEAGPDDCLPALVTPGSSLAGVLYPYNTHDNAMAPPVVTHGRFDIASDWNNDGQAQCANNAPAVDLNRLRPKHDRSSNQSLAGRDDWAVLVYDFRSSPSFPPGIHNPGLGDGPIAELDYPEHVALSQMLPAFCASDINDDRAINTDDLIALIGSWGACPQGCLADIAPIGAADGQVNTDDLIAIIVNWGPCP